MLLCLSFDHRSSAFPTLERLAQREAEITAACGALEFARGSAVLATCNRFEIYLDLHAAELPAAELSTAEFTTGGPQDDDPEHAGELTLAGDPATDADSLAVLALARIAAASGIPAHELNAEASLHPERSAAEHLIGVASGLHSAAVGEEEIAGQVRRAHTAAQRHGTMSHALERLFQAANRTSREVKHRTSLRDAGRSLVALSLRMAESRIADWRECRILLIGTGAYAGAVVAALRARGAQQIAVYSPSGRAADYAARHWLTPVPADGLGAALSAANLVVACTRVEEPILRRDDLAAAPATHPRLFLDLGMPRNIDADAVQTCDAAPSPSASPLASDELLDLETITRHASVAELGAEAEALQIVREAAEEFAAAQAERDALPAILTFRTHVLAIMEEELCRARKSHGGEDAEARVESEVTLRRFTGKLLHEPMTRMRSLARDGRTAQAHEALGMLFGLGEAGGEEVPPGRAAG